MREADVRRYLINFRDIGPPVEHDALRVPEVCTGSVAKHVPHNNVRYIQIIFWGQEAEEEQQPRMQGAWQELKLVRYPPQRHRAGLPAATTLVKHSNTRANKLIQAAAYSQKNTDHMGKRCDAMMMSVVLSVCCWAALRRQGVAT